MLEAAACTLSSKVCVLAGAIFCGSVGNSAKPHEMNSYRLFELRRDSRLHSQRTANGTHSEPPLFTFKKR
jgi:hypothetical protein